MASFIFTSVSAVGFAEGLYPILARLDGVAVASLTVQIRDLDHLHKLLTKLETLKDVRRVYRVTKRERTAL